MLVRAIIVIITGVAARRGWQCAQGRRLHAAGPPHSQLAPGQHSARPHHSAPHTHTSARSRTSNACSCGQSAHTTRYSSLQATQRCVTRRVACCRRRAVAARCRSTARAMQSDAPRSHHAGKVSTAVPQPAPAPRACRCQCASRRGVGLRKE